MQAPNAITEDRPQEQLAEIILDELHIVELGLLFVPLDQLAILGIIEY